MSLAPKITPADARVDWKLPAHVVDRLIRACTPEPGAWTEHDGARLKLGPGSVRARPTPRSLAPGELLAAKQACSSARARARCGSARCRPQGKRRMTASDWVRGLRSAAPCGLG